MKYLLCFVMLLFTTFLYAQKDSIDASKASSYVGQTIEVCDTIREARLKGVSKDEEDVLYTGSSDYAQRTFALVFPKDALARFPYNPNSKIINHRFSAKGKIVMYEGKPAMYIRDKNQLNVSE